MCDLASRAILAATALGALLAARGATALEATYLWNLSSTSGVLRTPTAPPVAYDGLNREVYVVDSGIVRIFNATGMEVFTFGDDSDLAPVLDVAPLDTGDVLVLSGAQGRPSVVRCNYRGERLGSWELRGAPAAAAALAPTHIESAGAQVYLFDEVRQAVVVAAADGSFSRFMDLRVLLRPEIEAGKGRKRHADAAYEIRGFKVDRDGSILFTIPTLFAAFIVSPDGQVQAFGTRGSSPGKFNVVVAIDRDENGNLYVADILKSAVIVFDKDLNFVEEFGYRGPRPDNLASPSNLAVGGGKVYVSQHARRGVSVFAIRRDAG